eukprot:scaffold18812_cov37-Tisochrysis_lutea.AAC.1
MRRNGRGESLKELDTDTHTDADAESDGREGEGCRRTGWARDMERVARASALLRRRCTMTCRRSWWRSCSTSSRSRWRSPSTCTSTRRAAS